MSMAPTTESENKVNEKNAGPPVRRFLRLHEVKLATGLGHATIYEWMARGDFPKPVQLGGRRVGWIEAEIADWQNKRIAERDTKATAA
jgi:prophage regulatory protein